VRVAEYPLERAVSEHIGAMPFLWLDVNDPSTGRDDRARIEAGCISLLSNAKRPPIDPPSPTWLGHCASRGAVRYSGLWNVNHVHDAPDPTSLLGLDRVINRMNRER